MPVADCRASVLTGCTEPPGLRSQKWIEQRDANLARKKKLKAKETANQPIPKISPKSKQLAGTRTRADLYNWHEEKLRKQRDKKKKKEDDELLELGLEPDLTISFASRTEALSNHTRETASFRRMAPTLSRDLTDIKHSRAVDEEVKSPVYDDSPLLDQKTIEETAERLHESSIGQVEELQPDIQSSPNLDQSFSSKVQEPEGSSMQRLSTRPAHHDALDSSFGHHSPHVQADELMARPDGSRHSSDIGRASPTHNEFLEARRRLMSTLSTTSGSVASSVIGAESAADSVESSSHSALGAMEEAFETRRTSAPRPSFDVPTKAKRKAMFHRMDVNGNGLLSLAEIDKCVVEEFPAFNHKPVLMRAYKAADANGNGLIGFREFNSLLHFLVYFNEKWTEFEAVDADGDRRINLDEFQRFSRSFGHELSDSEAAADFAAIDKNGGGYLLFDQFVAWCAYRHRSQIEESESDEEPAAAVSPVEFNAADALSPNTKLRLATEFIDGEWRRIDIGAWTADHGLSSEVAVILRAKGMDTLGDLLKQAATKAELVELGLSDATVETLWPVLCSLADGGGTTPSEVAVSLATDTDEDPFNAMEAELLEDQNDAGAAAAAGGEEEEDAFAAMEAEVLAQKGDEDKPAAVAAESPSATAAAEPPKATAAESQSGLADFHEQAQKLKQVMAAAEHKFGLVPGEQAVASAAAADPEESVAVPALVVPAAPAAVDEDDPFAAMEAILLKGGTNATAPEEEEDYEAFLDSF